MYTHINGPHGRVPVGKFKIGRIAQSRTPHFSNDVQNDPEVGDHECARREGLVSFVGHPLVVGDRLVGVVAAFARRPLTEAILSAFSSVANQVALLLIARGQEVTATLLGRIRNFSPGLGVKEPIRVVVSGTLG